MNIHFQSEQRPETSNRVDIEFQEPIQCSLVSPCSERCIFGGYQSISATSVGNSSSFAKVRPWRVDSYNGHYLYSATLRKLLKEDKHRQKKKNIAEKYASGNEINIKSSFNSWPLIVGATSYHVQRLVYDGDFNNWLSNNFVFCFSGGETRAFENARSKLELAGNLSVKN